MAIAKCRQRHPLSCAKLDLCALKMLIGVETARFCDNRTLDVTIGPKFVPMKSGCTYKEQTDAELWQACRARDEQAAVELYRRHVGWIYNLILAIVHDEETAQEGAADTLLSAFCDDELPRSTEAYLTRIATNKAIDAYRKNLTAVKQATIALDEDGPYEHPTANQESVLGHRDDVMRIISGLSASDYELLLGEWSETAGKGVIYAARQRARALVYPKDVYSDYRLLLCVAEKTTHAEIAHALGIPNSAVRRRIDEARERAQRSDRVLLMMKAENVPHAKIAKALGIPEAAVKLRIDQTQQRTRAQGIQDDGSVQHLGARSTQKKRRRMRK